MFKKCKLAPLVLIIPERHHDQRGFFSEFYNRKEYRDQGIDIEFVQDNFSFSKEIGTLRGLHFQAPPNAQAKLVRCARGAIFDVAVDIRSGSPTYGQWEGYELTSNNGNQLYIPIGFAHGFITLEPNSEVAYKCSNFYSPKDEGTVFWNDAEIGIDWSFKYNPLLSTKDASAPILKELKNPFIYGVNS